MRKKDHCDHFGSFGRLEEFCVSTVDGCFRTQATWPVLHELKARQAEEQTAWMEQNCLLAQAEVWETYQREACTGAFACSSCRAWCC
jgi:hypothetical protein